MSSEHLSDHTMEPSPHAIRHMTDDEHADHGEGAQSVGVGLPQGQERDAGDARDVFGVALERAEVHLDPGSRRGGRGGERSGRPGGGRGRGGVARAAGAVGVAWHGGSA